jgi:hypothetical protein
MNMVMIALRDGRCVQNLLAGLKSAGAHSATILDSTEMDILFWRGIRASLSGPACASGPGKTVLTLVPDVLTRSVVEAAERALVGFTGMVCAWPIDHAVAFQGDMRGEARGEVRAAEPARRFA